MWVRFLLLLGFLCVPLSWAGDEDVRRREETPPPEVMEPEPVEQPPEDLPDPSLGQDEPEPEPKVEPRPQQRRQVRRSAPPVRRQRRWMNTNPDQNIDTSRVEGSVRRAPLPDGVLRPALGARGYRPSFIGMGVGDRTPGYGLLVEHSFDRLGIGFAASYLPLTRDRRASEYSFYNFYGFYRWLPYSMSPYLHAGVQYGLGTPLSFGLLGGAGVDMRIYAGLTLYFGYTFHSVAEKGYWGGALGWAF